MIYHVTSQDPSVIKCCIAFLVGAEISLESFLFAGWQVSPSFNTISLWYNIHHITNTNTISLWYTHSWEVFKKSCHLSQQLHPGDPKAFFFISALLPPLPLLWDKTLVEDFIAGCKCYFPLRNVRKVVNNYAVVIYPWWWWLFLWRWGWRQCRWCCGHENHHFLLVKIAT